MARLKVIIFTEGGRNIGFGHITRCLALRDAFESKGMDASLIVNGDLLVRQHFREKDIIFLNWLKNERKVMDFLRLADVVVIDSYLAPLSFYQKVSLAAQLPVFIDDFMRLNYPTGMIVAGAIGAETFRYARKKGQTYLLGARYALLRKEFWNSPRRKMRSAINNVLITFGGMDRSVFIFELICHLRPKFPNWNFHVVTAQPFNLKSSKCLSKSFFYSGISAQKMKELIYRCDIAISGGGQTTNELAAGGLPTIGICFADNQKRNLSGWQHRGFLSLAGRFSERMIFSKIEQKLRVASHKKRQLMAKRGQSLVDGMGACRIADTILKSEEGS